MKTRSIYILLGGLITLASCNKSDDFKGTINVFDPPNLEGGAPAKDRIKFMYEKYNVLFKPTFDLIEYTWDWQTTIKQTGPTESGTRFTPAKEAYVIPVIDSIEKWVFNVFPLEFSKKYMPLNILMTDTMENKYALGTNIVHRIYEGFIATDYILVPYVSERFDAEKGKRLLRESWLSLFIEKILNQLPPPIEFGAVSKDGYAKITFTNAEDVMVNYALLKKGRTKQNSSSASAAWNKTTPAQDFGDFVAFIVYTPDTEKEAVYAKNVLIRTKVGLVKDYFQDNFGIELPYIPVSN